MSVDWNEEVETYLQDKDLTVTTWKMVKHALEAKHGKPLIKENKDFLKQKVKAIAKEVLAQDSKESEESQEESDKKAVKAQIFTASGKAPPRLLKKLQASILTKAEFHKNAQPVELSIFGNRAIGPPREFTSGNNGWWTGGKIEVPIGDKTVWAQLGVTITLLGSQTWQ